VGGKELGCSFGSVRTAGLYKNGVSRTSERRLSTGFSVRRQYPYQPAGEGVCDLTNDVCSSLQETIF
jgi:hypothetical protein